MGSGSRASHYLTPSTHVFHLKCPGLANLSFRVSPPIFSLFTLFWLLYYTWSDQNIPGALSLVSSPLPQVCERSRRQLRAAAGAEVPPPRSPPDRRVLPSAPRSRRRRYPLPSGTASSPLPSCPIPRANGRRPSSPARAAPRRVKPLPAPAAASSAAAPRSPPARSPLTGTQHLVAAAEEELEMEAGPPAPEKTHAAT